MIFPETYNTSQRMNGVQSSIIIVAYVARENGSIYIKVSAYISKIIESARLPMIRR